MSTERQTNEGSPPVLFHVWTANTNAGMLAFTIAIGVISNEGNVSINGRPNSSLRGKTG